MKGAVLVTDGEQRAALAMVRSLGRAGWDVGVCAARKRSLAGASRFCRWAMLAPNPLSEPGAFVDALADCTRRTGAQIVLPISEAALLAVLPARERLHPAIVPFPSIDVFRRISDKAAVTDAACAEGIRVPRQVQVESAGKAREGLGEVRFPVVIKPSRSVGEANGRRAKFGVGYAVDATSLATKLAALDAAAFPVLLQERIVGTGAGVFVLTWGGEPLATFAHRRLREKPPSGGVSVLRESVPLDPTLLAKSLGLLRRLQWDGVAMVEYKVGEDGVPYLMEINGRFWGSLQLAIDAGVDFPRLLVEAALGNSPTPVTSYSTGVLTRWGWGDVDHLLAMWRHSRQALALPPGAPGRWRTLREFVLAFGPHVHGEVLRWSDPLPFVVESLDWIRRR